MKNLLISFLLITSVFFTANSYSQETQVTTAQQSAITNSIPVPKPDPTGANTGSINDIKGLSSGSPTDDDLKQIETIKKKRAFCC